MTFPRTYKIVLGILTAIPLIDYFVLFAVLGIFYRNILVALLDNWLFMMIQVSVVILAISLMLFYTKDVTHNDELTDSEKTRWLGIIFFLNVLSMPTYFYKYVWRRDNKPSS